MRSLEFWILAYLLNSLWQVPLLFAAAWIAARTLRSLGAAMEHRVWVIALLLQSLLPALSIFPWEWLRMPFWGGNVSRAGEAHVSVTVGEGTGIGVLQLPGALLEAITILYVAVTVFFAVRFLWRAINLSGLRREAVPVPLTGQVVLFWQRCLKRFEVQDVTIAASSRVFGPVTLGIRRKLLLLPVNVVEELPEADLHTVIAHEFAHMRRKDFMKNLVYELLSMPVSYHPLLWLTRARIMESREMVCDQMAAAVTGPNEYAQSLLRLASLLITGTLGRTPHTIGIFDANVFERRLMNVTEKQQEVRGVRRVVILAACAGLALITCGSALALGMHANAASGGSDSHATKAPKQLTVSQEEMQGNLLTKAVPVYPPAAKKARIQGKVVLDAVIGTDGHVENLRVLSGPPELQQSALDAVRQWTYKPYLLNGDPIEVETTVNIIYMLGG
jgi:bla regulator protein blaR1